MLELELPKAPFRGVWQIKQIKAKEESFTAVHAWQCQAPAGEDVDDDLSTCATGAVALVVVLVGERLCVLKLSSFWRFFF